MSGSTHGLKKEITPAANAILIFKKFNDIIADPAAVPALSAINTATTVGRLAILLN